MRPLLMLRGIILAGSLFASTSAFAQDPKLQDKALAAGYKAMFTCSAVFNGGKTAEQIAADELDNIYGDYAPAMEAIGAPEVDGISKIVSVSYNKNTPPRPVSYTHLTLPTTPYV